MLPVFYNFQLPDPNRSLVTSAMTSDESNMTSDCSQAWEVRDKAVARKNATEIDLARARIDVMQINSQLLESIQQKVELSCQLDQWQVSAVGQDGAATAPARYTKQSYDLTKFIRKQICHTIRCGLFAFV